LARAAIVVAFAASAVGGFVVDTPAPASAAVRPGLSVSPGAGQVSTVVTLRFGPANNGCQSVKFESAAGASGGSLTLPFVGGHGTQYFVIPRYWSRNAPVAPGKYTFSLRCNATNDPANAITVSVPYKVIAAPSAPFVGMAVSSGGLGYWLAKADGGVVKRGHASFYGSLPGSRIVPSSRIVGIAAVPSALGYWLVGADGAVYAFGSAQSYGSIRGKHLDPPVVGIAATATGKGYWEVAADGAIFPFGDARSYGAMAGRHLNRPIVGMAAAPDGSGYWEVASDGGIFTFGSARFRGSMGGHVLNRPIVGMSAARGGGYWEVAADGGVFAFAAQFIGSTGSVPASAPIVAMSAMPAGQGYRLLAINGSVFDFGGARFYGNGAPVRVLPVGTALIGVDGNTGVALALDSDGRPLHALFSIGVTDHRPNQRQFHLSPDQRTLLFATNPVGPRQCSAITTRGLNTEPTRAAFGGTWAAVSPDDTHLAFTGCLRHDRTVTVIDVPHYRRWIARVPATAVRGTPVGNIAWTPDGRTVLAEYLDASGGWKLSALTPRAHPDDGVGAIPWGPNVLNLEGQSGLTATPGALYVYGGTVRRGFSIDAYDWSYHLISHTPIALDPLEVVVNDGRTYFVGMPFTRGPSFNTGLYRLEANGTITELRHGIGEIVAVPAEPRR
jgi:hypothetical protein